jgi:Family of unknown function (DUF5946)
MSTVSDEPCPSCGARVGGRQACQEIFNELSALAWSSPARASVHNLVVDAYAMQHSEEYGRSVKSCVAHLTALCCGIEAAGDTELYWQIPRWLDGHVNFVRPPDLRNRGSITVADVWRPAGEEEYPQLVRRWAENVWHACSSVQGQARQWLDAVRAHRHGAVRKKG